MNFTPSEPESVYIEGIIVDEPQSGRTYYGETKVSFILRADSFQKGNIKQAVTGKVKVFISGEVGKLNYGDRILINGLLSSPRGPGNPGEFDYATYLKRRGIFSILSAKSNNVIILKEGGGNPFFRAAYFVRNKIDKIIISYLPPGSANFLNAVLLGQRQDIDFELNDTFMKTGTVHLLAISGLHIGLLVFLVMLILKMLRFPYKLNIIATMFFLIFYAILTNGRPSVVRATIMAQVILVGTLIGRESSIWNSLGLAAIIILGFEPNALFDAGFQLSFISVASILYIMPKSEELFYYNRKLSSSFIGRWKRYLIEAAFASAAVWIGILPFILCYFNIVTPIAVLANLFAVPLTFLIIASSIPFIIFGAVVPLVGKIFAGTTWLLCVTLFGITDIFSKIPLSYLYFPKPSPFLIFVYYIFIVALIGHKRFKISVGKIAIVGLVLINILVWPGALKQNDGRLSVTFLDVGHGDSIFIEFPNGENMLIDGGKGRDTDMGQKVILPFLRNKGIYSIDAIVLTHPDADHVGGLTSVIKGLNVKRIFENGVRSDSDEYLNFEDVITRKKIERIILRCGDSIVGAAKTKVICLNPPMEWATNPNIEDNDNSLVIKIHYKDIDLLFCADIEEKAINEILKYGQMLDADLIMLPHHGEKLTSRGEAFIEKVSPRYAVISQGRALREVLRSRGTEEFLLAKGIKVLRTNRDGAISVVTDGRVIFVDSFKRY
ncbi:MAG: hypothetical protein AMJ78_04495 [Omnitrophica WOR_2 bacterium SM23_29]|nr:MAG: hypothetical protein AMJ78_04495 [Omnitrophica WOR_2 bacterium SM23_29]